MSRRGLDKEKVLQVAGELLNQKGFEALNTAELARKLKVKAPSLYKHVSGLPELRRSLSLRGMHGLADRLRRAAVGKAGAPALLAIAHAYREFVRENPGTYELMIQAPPKDDKEWESAGWAIVEVVWQSMADYGFNKEQAVHVIRCFRSAVHGFASLESRAGFGLPQKIDESFELLLEIFIMGLSSWSKGAGVRSG